ncbi:hypothetical protein CTRI78_v010121 [Colletotrichum trifolii]|uniref:Uncharacterized protein n=1 Tax=Colletotrichum trifolii TaxID=5466 RepID=A0A4R8QWI6_COLTR|nr:hypothetical protein CTRI78_v010121 [Colletotrichum trifolii]
MSLSLAVLDLTWAVLKSCCLCVVSLENSIKPSRLTVVSACAVDASVVTTQHDALPRRPTNLRLGYQEPRPRLSWIIPFLNSATPAASSPTPLKDPPISSPPPSDDVLSQDFHRQVVTKLMRNESYTHNNHEGKKVLPAVDAASIAQAPSPLARPQPTPRA